MNKELKRNIQYPEIRMNMSISNTKCSKLKTNSRQGVT